MKTIIFDFDGTLVSSPSMWNISVAKAIKEVAGVDCDPAEIRKIAHTGYPWEHYAQDNSDKTGGNFWSFMEKHFAYVCAQLGFDKETGEKIAVNVRKYILDIDNYRLYSDTLETVAKCREKGYKIVLLSNNFPELDDICRKIFGENYFDAVISSGVCGFDKPRREIFELAMKAVGADPRQTYMVGDNATADISGGKTAGLTTILVHKKAQCDADHVCDELIDIVDIIK